MRYTEKTFTLPVSSPKVTQTDWEIAVGLRNPDGSLVQPKAGCKRHALKLWSCTACNKEALKRMERELSE